MSIAALYRSGILACVVLSATASLALDQDEVKPMKELEWLIGKWDVVLRDAQSKSYHKVDDLSIHLGPKGKTLEVKYTHTGLATFDERTSLGFVETIRKEGEVWKKETSWKKVGGYVRVGPGKSTGYLKKTAKDTWEGKTARKIARGNVENKCIILKRVNENTFIYVWDDVEFTCTRKPTKKAATNK